MASKKEIYEKRNIYSWGAKVDFMINNRGGFSDLQNASISLLWDDNYILELEPRAIHPQFEQAGATGYRLTINATDTASDAENLGCKLAYALLSVAIDKRWGMSLSWPDSPLPCRVIDRTASVGATMQGFGTVTCPVKTSEFVEVLEKSFSEHDVIPYALLLSKELCASSHFENNSRSKLIMLMSSLEALAKQLDLSSELRETTDALKAIVNEAEIESQSLKDSLIGQINGLKRESVRRAIQRLLVDSQLSKSDRRFVDDAYQFRSKIVHEGLRVPELERINVRLEQILRKVYESYS